MTAGDDLTEVVDSPDPSVAEHVARYLASGGTDGYLEGGVTNLVLTVVGRKTGRLHRTGLFFGEDDGRYILVASGSRITPEPPNWYRNVLVNPEVHVQVGADRFIARARTAEGDERRRLWDLMTTRAPIYRTHYEPRTRRQIPVVVLERQAPA